MLLTPDTGSVSVHSMLADTKHNLFTCQPGFEELLKNEIIGTGFGVSENGRGWACAQGDCGEEFCFAHLRLMNATEIESPSINALSAQLIDHFMQQVDGVILPQGWPLIFRFADGITGLGQRVKTVEKEFRSRLKKRMAGLERKAGSDLPRGGGESLGLFVFFTSFNRLYVSTKAWSGGQRRMADDPAAPSRSYLKTEEAFAALGREPEQGETAIDLGAAPGGWSYSVAKRGAQVLAIDNGPMKGGAKDHPLIEHRRADAFKIMPSAGESYDWLLCDLVEEPHHVMRLIEQWLKNRHCQNFVVNLKFGRANALRLLDEVLDPQGRLLPYCSELRVRHLFHDRDEFTLMGRLS